MSDRPTIVLASSISNGLVDLEACVDSRSNYIDNLTPTSIPLAIVLYIVLLLSEIGMAPICLDEWLIYEVWVQLAEGFFYRDNTPELS